MAYVLQKTHTILLTLLWCHNLLSKQAYPIHIYSQTTDNRTKGQFPLNEKESLYSMFSNRCLLSNNVHCGIADSFLHYGALVFNVLNNKIYKCYLKLTLFQFVMSTRKSSSYNFIFTWI